MKISKKELAKKVSLLEVELWSNDNLVREQCKKIDKLQKDNNALKNKFIELCEFLNVEYYTKSEKENSGQNIFDENPDRSDVSLKRGFRKIKKTKNGK